MRAVEWFDTSRHSHWPRYHPDADRFHNHQTGGVSLFTTSFTLSLSGCPSFLLSLCNSRPIYTRIQSRFSLSLSPLEKSHHLSILGCGNSHLFGTADMVPHHPHPSPLLHSLLFLIFFLPFLAEPFRLSAPPTPPLPGESLNLLNRGSQCSTASHKKMYQCCL